MENYGIFFPLPVFCDSHLAKSEMLCRALENRFVTAKPPPSHLAPSWALDKFSAPPALPFLQRLPVLKLLEKKKTHKVLTMQTGVQSPSRPLFLSPVGAMLLSSPQTPHTHLPPGLARVIPTVGNALDSVCKLSSDAASSLSLRRSDC